MVSGKFLDRFDGPGRGGLWIVNQDERSPGLRPGRRLRGRQRDVTAVLVNTIRSQDPQHTLGDRAALTDGFGREPPENPRLSTTCIPCQENEPRARSLIEIIHQLAKFAVASRWGPGCQSSRPCRPCLDLEVQITCRAQLREGLGGGRRAITGIGGEHSREPISQSLGMLSGQAWNHRRFVRHPMDESCEVQLSGRDRWMPQDRLVNQHSQ